MNTKVTLKVLIPILIIFYLFMNPFLEYVNNYGKITYVMDIPDRPNDNSKNLESISIKDVDTTNLPKIEKQIVESWVVSFPNISGNKEIKAFKSKAKDIGIKSFIFVKNNKKRIISIGPYVDEAMAVRMKNKIVKLLDYDGKILRINN
ncbi:MAG: hypothetical protein VYA22_01520 [Pseudomonadota bacterium]|nr:hypothetical protein [Pseudomonadota bacterium]|tara:strand:+ start:289 stop:732 length:444 start_codon:yes stop_codon:yes gene_type:complete